MKEKLKKSGVKWADFCVKSAGGTQVGGILRFLKKKWAVIDIFMSFLVVRCLKTSIYFRLMLVYILFFVKRT